MVDLFFYKKIEDVEEQAAIKEGEDKAAVQDQKKWDAQQGEEEGAEGEEQWAA